MTKLHRVLSGHATKTVLEYQDMRKRKRDEARDRKILGDRVRLRIIKYTGTQYSLAIRLGCSENHITKTMCSNYPPIPVLQRMEAGCETIGLK